MRNRLLLFISIASGALIQLFLPVWPLFGEIKPPVLIALVLYFSLQSSSHSMWVAVFWAALLHDGLDLGQCGPALMGFPIIAILTHRVRLEIFTEGLITQIVFGALGSLLVMSITVLFYTLSGQRPFHLGSSLLRIAGSSLFGAATLPIVCWSMRKLEAALPKPREYGWQ